MKKTLISNLIIAAAAAAMMLACATSCQEPAGNTSKRALGFDVKSADTRCTPTTTAGLETAGTFYSEAFEAGTTTRYYDRTETTFDGSKWKTLKYWPEDYEQALDFWAYAPTSVFDEVSTSISGQQMTISNYAPYHNAVTRHDATYQEDVIVAATFDRKYADNASHLVPMTFNHALTAVRFKIGVLDGFNSTDQIEIISIGINDIYGKGTCTCNASGTFSWVTTGDKASYIQMIDQTSPVTYVTTGMYLDTFSTDATTIGSDVFMLIPQTIPSGASLTVNWALNGVQYTSRTAAIADAVTLEAGKIYTFTLGITERDRLITVLLTDILPWEGVTNTIDFSHQAAASQMLTFDPETCSIDPVNHIVAFVDGAPIKCRFHLESPLGSTFLVRFMRDFDAFQFDYVSSPTITEETLYSEFMITPLIAAPERNYYLTLQISVRAADGRVINCDNILQGTNTDEYYTLVLPKTN